MMSAVTTAAKTKTDQHGTSLRGPGRRRLVRVGDEIDSKSKRTCGDESRQFTDMMDITETRNLKQE